MGLIYEHGHPVIADIETIAHERAAEFLPLPDLDHLDPPKNYTKPETIEQWRIDEKARRLKAWEDDIAKCALDPDLNRIVALGYVGVSKRDEPMVVTCPSEADEVKALTDFWAFARHSQLIGYNFAGFDAPTLVRRSLLLGVQAPGLSISKYRHPAITDVMQVLSFDHMLPWRKQSFYLKRFGLDVTLPKDCVTGADIAQLVREEAWDTIRHHVRCDVLGCRALAVHIGLISLLKPPPRTREQQPELPVETPVL